MIVLIAFIQLMNIFLSQSPRKIRERFTFIFENSIGMHESIMQLLVSISTKSMLFGSFCNGVNEVRRVKHSRDMINYLDNAYNAIEKKKVYFPNK